MSVGLRLDLRQSQQLVMTPQLQQAIKLLQMSNLELSAFVDIELEKNPLLKAESDIPESVVEDEGPLPGDADQSREQATDRRTEDHTLSEHTFDTGHEHLQDSSPSDGPAPGATLGTISGTGGRHDFENFPDTSERLAEEVSLRAHLLSQLGQMHVPPVTLMIARYMVDELDEHGYLRRDLEEIAERLVAPLSEMESALEVLQSCEPTGVGARTLAECLTLQLREASMLDAPMAALLDNLELVARNDRRRLCALCRVSETELGQLIQNLRIANPRPCSHFQRADAETLVPDVLLKRTKWGGWQLELNPDTLPRVLIDRTYISAIGTQGCTKTQQFLSDCRSNANWLIKSLDQRAKTIVKIATEIVRQQEAFFEKGVSGLKPLTLKDVADAVSMHESTASRVTANKYISTDRGIFELKYFFTNAIGGGGESDVSAEAVRHRIKTMVSAEASNAILSDDAIVDALAREGVEIARRTVAKYRNSLNIPSSVERRRQKAINLSA